MRQIKVLIDRSVRSDAVVGEHGFQFVEGEALGQKHEYLQPVTRIKAPRKDWKQTEIECLPKIAKHIRSGQIQAFTSGELDAEEFRVLKYPSNGFIDIFEECSFDTLPAPLDRSKWSLNAEQYLDKKAVIQYCKCFFLTATRERTEEFINGMRDNPQFGLSSFEQQCLRNVDTFKSICRGIDSSHYPDALHLWTAEENGVDFFLTLDKKFKNVICRQKISIRCEVVFPSTLLQYFCPA